jgi:hypothetical protein
MSARFASGTAVIIVDRPAHGHVRVPRYIRGKRGRVAECLGAFLNPEDLAFGKTAGPAIPLYRIRFQQGAIWSGYDGPPKDSVFIEIPEHWLKEDLPL